MNLECPECGNTEQSRFIGHEVRGIYDGVLYWVCGECGRAQPREFLNTRRDQASRDFTERWNAERQQ